MNYQHLAQELVRALRGKRSQTALSRRLKYKTNVLYTWESGKREPTAVQFFALARCCGKATAATLSRFYRRAPDWISDDRSDRELVVSMLEHEKGRVPLIHVARDTSMSRFSLARYFRGDADIKLADFLRVIDICTRRLLDFLALWTDPAGLSSSRGAWNRQQLARRSAYERPWSHAVLRCLELSQYRQSREHNPAFFADRLGISLEEVEQCIHLLSEADQISWTGSHWKLGTELTIELGDDLNAARALSSWWLGVATERSKEAQRGMFAYNLCSVSSEDLLRIAELQRTCLKQIRSIVAESKPSERVALVAVQVIGLDGAVKPE